MGLLGILLAIFFGGVAIGVFIGYSWGSYKEAMFWMDIFHPKKKPCSQDGIMIDEEKANGRV